jgi:RHS repeat-associated protein
VVNLPRPEVVNLIGACNYGARRYDPQIGKWAVIDNMAASFVSESPYSYGGNNAISNVDVGGKFQFPVNQLKWIKKNYPTFYNYIMSPSGAEALKKSTTVIGAILKFSKWDKAELLKDFNHGSGAELRVSDIDVKGQTQNVSPYNLTIASKLLELIEKAKPEDKEAALLFAMLNVLHEEAHRGNHKFGTTGGGNIITGEDGDAVVKELVSGNENLFQDISGLNFADPDWKQKAINIAKQIIAQQQEKMQKQNDEIDNTSLPANIKEFLKQASKAGATITIKN